MEKEIYLENQAELRHENKFKGKTANEIYKSLVSGVISSEEFIAEYNKIVDFGNSSYTGQIKIKQAIEGIKKGDKFAIQEIRKLIIRMKYR